MLGPLKFYGQPYGTPACTGIAPALDRCVQMQGLGRGNNSIGAPTILREEATGWNKLRAAPVGPTILRARINGVMGMQGGMAGQLAGD